mmetsp:Transcript_12753/g.18294  ORF Transcript_12753/g.18294 Transcript_12753/m.18294 type:complete len:156 (+) Transcript_12753:95-562(+)
MYARVYGSVVTIVCTSFVVVLTYYIQLIGLGLNRIKSTIVYIYFVVKEKRSQRTQLIHHPHHQPSWLTKNKVKIELQRTSDETTNTEIDITDNNNTNDKLASVITNGRRTRLSIPPPPPPCGDDDDDDDKGYNRSPHSEISQQILLLQVQNHPVP